MLQSVMQIGQLRRLEKEKDLVWISSDPAVLSMENGIATAHKAGRATVTVSLRSSDGADAADEILPSAAINVTVR